MKSLFLLTLFLCLTLITSTPWSCAQIFANAGTPTGNCYPPTQTNQQAGYYQTGGYGNTEIYCILNYKNAVYQLRQCAFQNCQTSYGFDAMCLCQKCKGNYYNGNQPYRTFFSTMLSTCSSGTPVVCGV